MNYKLHYAELNLTSDIPCLQFDSKNKLLDYVHTIYKNNSYTRLKVICIVQIGENLIVVNSMKSILDFINDLLDEHESIHQLFGNDVSIHEFSSYEEAYKFAILLKEESRLCYSDNVEIDLYPVYFNGQQYQQDQCAELFVSVYTDRCQLNDAGGIYLGDGCSVYPDGSID
jgi:hypothetical protein